MIGHLFLYFNGRFVICSKNMTTVTKKCIHSMLIGPPFVFFYFVIISDMVCSKFEFLLNNHVSLVYTRVTLTSSVGICGGYFFRTYWRLTSWCSALNKLGFDRAFLGIWVQTTCTNIVPPSFEFRGFILHLNPSTIFKLPMERKMHRSTKW